METRAPSPPSPSDPPRRDRPTRQISDFPPNSPDRALRFTAIRASERFRGRVAFPALSGPLPRSAITNASARNARHGAPRGPIRPRCQSTKRPASTSRRALNSPRVTLFGTLGNPGRAAGGFRRRTPRWVASRRDKRSGHLANDCARVPISFQPGGPREETGTARGRSRTSSAAPKEVPLEALRDRAARRLGFATATHALHTQGRCR